MKKASSLTLKIMSLILVIVVIGCNQKNTETANKTEFNLENAKSETEATNKNFMALVAAGDTIGLANADAADAKFVTDG